MLVYGDHHERADPDERLRELGALLSTVAAMPPGVARHGKLVGVLVEAGQLLQGVADEGWASAELNEFVYRLAAVVVRSWDSRFAHRGEIPPVPEVALPPSVDLRLPEGFAFYAVYPEAYIDAARSLRLSGPPQVVGIRSIGTTLAAVVAAALEAPPPITVRPFGEPFSRKVQLPRFIVDDHSHYVIVDEGPGLSGSSFGSVADALESSGVPIQRIAFLPSHDGDLGPQASEAHRSRWARARRIAARFDESWLAELYGPLEEIAGGSQWARRKFLGCRAGERVLVKFAGLGAIGERKLEMARALHSAGFTAKPIEFVHGFLVERWCEDAQPLRDDDKPVDQIGRYIGARARLFPASEDSGATIAELIRMCRRNISLAFDGACSVLNRFDAQSLQLSVRPVRTDNKLDRHEWLRMPDGRLLKTDAVDHHQAHDLIGCQDPSWDVAGAIMEFDLDSAETREVIAASRCEIDRDLLDLCCIAYASFRLGRAVLADEADEVARYRRSLHRLLDQHLCPETRHESLVD